MALKQGDKAPDFKLFNTDKTEVSLSDFSGKNLIVHFFPAAFTGICTKQLCTLRDGISLYHNDKTDVVAISVDSLFALAKFKEEQNLNFTLLSDFNKVTSTDFGAIYFDWILGMKGVSKRAAFVIDKNGTIQYAEVLESAGDLPNFVAIDEVLNNLN
jgi:peroxiredoxin